MTYFEMTKTMLKSLFSRPATLMYPAKPAKKTALSRGHVTINPDGCITCPVLPAQVPDAGHLRGGQGEDLADRPAALHRLRLLCRGLPHEVPRDGHPVFGSDDRPPWVVLVPVAGPKKKNRLRWLGIKKE